MPSRTRAIFIASQVEGLSYAEIARREGLFLWQVRRHMLRAIRIIAREMR
jgi:DNA-directed RNA polymerase specialized sigma24 family protein